MARYSIKQLPVFLHFQKGNAFKTPEMWYPSNEKPLSDWLREKMKVNIKVHNIRQEAIVVTVLRQHNVVEHKSTLQSGKIIEITSLPGRQLLINTKDGRFIKGITIDDDLKDVIKIMEKESSSLRENGALWVQKERQRIEMMSIRRISRVSMVSTFQLLKKDGKSSHVTVRKAA